MLSDEIKEELESILRKLPDDLKKVIITFDIDLGIEIYSDEGYELLPFIKDVIFPDELEGI